MRAESRATHGERRAATRLGASVTSSQDGSVALGEACGDALYTVMRGPIACVVICTSPNATKFRRNRAVEFNKRCRATNRPCFCWLLGGVCRVNRSAFPESQQHAWQCEGVRATTSNAKKIRNAICEEVTRELISHTQ